MNINDLWKYDLRRGSSDDPINGACLYDAATWIAYGMVGDDPGCACPVIRAYAIGANDVMDDTERQKLKPFILRVVGNRDPAHEQARAEYIVRETARRVLPLAFDAVGLSAEAARLRALPADATMESIAGAAAAAADATEAAHAAAAALTAARATAEAAAWAVDAAHATAAAWAARAALAAARAAGAAAGAADIWPTAIEILDGALRIGKQADPFDEQLVRQAVEAFERARMPALA